MAATAFPNYTQIPSRISVRTWWAIRVASIVAALVVAALLIASPDDGLFVMWKIVIPLLPLLFLVAPGVWRNICPLAAANQTPRVLGLTRALTAPKWLKEYGYVVAISLFVLFVILRKLGLDDNGPASALLLLGALTGGFMGGVYLKGKSGWCSSICPLLPVQRIYGQTPFALVPNSHCQPCVGCTTNCYDFNPRAAYLADLSSPDPYWSGYRRFFVAAFPGLVLAFFKVPEAPDSIGVAEMLGRIALYMGVSIASFQLLDTFLKVSTHKLTTLYGAAAFNIFYWFGAPDLVAAITGESSPDALTWAMRAGVLALTLAWIVQTYRKESLFHAEAAARAGGLSAAASRSLTRSRSLRAGAPEVTVVPDGTRLVAKPGTTVLELAESNGLAIEAGCRMGVCGADPIAVKEGMENLSPVSDDERSTLDRLGHAENTRMACCCRVKGPVSVALTPEKAGAATPSQIARMSYDRSIERVVVIGNGIAGVTAADHVRRRHPACRIDLVADEAHPLYNRMGISRLIYGRSAMAGLYLNPDSWYSDRAIEPWLNTRAQEIDRARGEVHLGTGDRLPYDRLILAMGSSAAVPRIDGFGERGTFVVRSAEDALSIRSFAQREWCREAVVAGGGLLGLEAGYALHKLGLHASVLERSDRLLRRQLDARASELLRRYIEGLGMTVVMKADTAAALGDERLSEVLLRDGRGLPADLLLVCAGVTPNVELAAAAGLRVGKGVLVDDRMGTDDPRVFAAGDVAEHGGRVYGLWPTAVEQAEVAAAAALGEEKTYHGTVPVTILKVVGVELTSIGRFEPEPGEEEIVLEDEVGQRYGKLVISRDGRIAGAILLGYSAEASPVVTAVKRGYDVSGVLDRLRAGRWDVIAEMSGSHPLVAAAPAHPGSS
ncbi:MAG TPA: FAD-dependent oxidoreductase [Solirubrobacteraceae bacterium]|nr:FAD-dependent oxidoreductase [Solirubrobacteraceae bacterium]